MTVPIRARLREAVIAAPLTPVTADGRIDVPTLENYATALCSVVDGVCVWAHTGRGLYLDADERATVLRTFRAATTGPVLAGVGVPVGTASTGFADDLAATVAMASEAAQHGADGVMVYPSARLDGPDIRERSIELHQAVAEETGLPVIVFRLYPEAGGVCYPAEVLHDLMSVPGVIGAKLATLDSAIGCQEAIAAVHAGGGLVLTGEDRMYGPSLMWGSDGALIGIAAAAPQLSVAVARAWFAGKTEAFIDASNRLDQFAALTFTNPMQGYIQRLFWASVHEGTIPEAMARDPYAPADLLDSDRERITDFLDNLPAG